MDTDSTIAQHHAPTEQQSRPSGSYAFLNHSSMTLPNNLPPDVDDRPLARQKRRRTSPEDQSILEEAYDRDPKPDKAARIELVKRVALGEKEVQIWFQNRRQTSRRKSRPLLPHEIVQYQLLRSSQLSFSGLDGAGDLDDCMHAESLAKIGSADQADGRFDPTFPDNLGDEASLTSSSQTLQTSMTAAMLSSQPTASTRFCTSFNSHLANRRSVPSLRVDHRGAADVDDLRRHSQLNTNRGLKKSSSIVRLSLTSEGKAEITTKNGSSPSPPRPCQTPEVYATADAAQKDSKVPVEIHRAPPLKPLQRSSSGRSRDSRAWEFWCDKDARGELEDKAEKDASGSAADAIDLLRSTSGRKVLGTLSTKRNFALSRQPSSKRSRLGLKPASLQRSSTSSGRLQGKSMNVAAKPALKLKHAESAVSVYIVGNDSDKENWSPDGLNGSRDAGHLQASDNSGMQGAAATRTHARAASFQKLDTSPNDENTDPEADPELAAFMRGGNSSVAGVDDLDCVQGLLSLSQGNWR